MRCTGPDGSGSLLPVFRTLRFQTVKIRTTHPKRAAGLDHQARAASCPLAPSEVAGITDREGRKTSYTYNAAGRQTADNLLNSSRVSIYSIAYAYDNASRLTSAGGPDAAYAFTIAPLLYCLFRFVRVPARLTTLIGK